ncbi:MAG: hypothetical protein JXR37_31245 [Kiritimatiellae bacterium]|nr:hypothetical protein [Kiritimatiellia bacterium]
MRRIRVFGVLACWLGGALAANAGEGSRVSMDTVEGLTAVKGYRAEQAQIALDTEDKKEGTGSVRLSFRASAAGYGIAQMETTVPSFDMTGRKFEVYVKPLDNRHGYWGVEFYDAAGSLVETHRVFALKKGQWNPFAFTQGQKLQYGWYKRGTGNPTQVTKIVFRAQTKKGGVEAAMLWDGFRSIEQPVAALPTAP